MVMAPSACTAAEELYISKQDFISSNNLFGNSFPGHHGGDDQFPQLRPTAKELVFDVLKKRATDVDVDRCDPGEEDAFYVADMGEVYRQHLRWKMNLRRVKPFYGKCGLNIRVLLLAFANN